MECALDADEQRSSRSSMLCSVVQLRARAAADLASAFDVKTRGHEPSPSAAMAPLKRRPRYAVRTVGGHDGEESTSHVVADILIEVRWRRG